MASNNIIYNVTLENHAFYPGIVERYVEQRADGKFYINSFGEGNGAYPKLNDEAGGILFSGHTTVLN